MPRSGLKQITALKHCEQAAALCRFASSYHGVVAARLLQAENSLKYMHVAKSWVVACYSAI